MSTNIQGRVAERVFLKHKFNQIDPAKIKSKGIRTLVMFIQASL